MTKEMTQQEFDEYRRKKNRAMLSTHWPRIRKYLEKGVTPAEIAESMKAEGYPGFNSSSIGLQDIKRLMELATEID